MMFKLTRMIQGLRLLKNPPVKTSQLIKSSSLVSSQPTRSLISCHDSDPMILYTDAVEATHRRTCEFGKCDVGLLASMLPPSQDILPPRSMKDSLLKTYLPIGSCSETRLKYTSHIGGARLGKIVQDMDYFAAMVLYQHILNPLQHDPKGLSAHAVVTARMDHLIWKENIVHDKDVVFIGHVTWVGKSSAEVGVRVEQVMGDHGRRKHVCEARFVMVARDAASGTKSAPINPLIVTSPEEKYLFSQGEKNIALRAKADQDSLFKEPPAQEESSLIHKMFLSTIDHKARSFSARIRPENSSWMTDSKLKSVMLCEPEHKNDYNKVKCRLRTLYSNNIAGVRWSDHGEVC